MAKRYEVTLTVEANDEAHIYEMVRHMPIGPVMVPSVDSVTELEEEEDEESYLERTTQDAMMGGRW